VTPPSSAASDWLTFRMLRDQFGNYFGEQSQEKGLIRNYTFGGTYYTCARTAYCGATIYIYTYNESVRD
jgi:hypothetical protein